MISWWHTQAEQWNLFRTQNHWLWLNCIQIMRERKHWGKSSDWRVSSRPERQRSQTTEEGRLICDAVGAFYPAGLTRKKGSELTDSTRKHTGVKSEQTYMQIWKVFCGIKEAQGSVRNPSSWWTAESDSQKVYWYRESLNLRINKCTSSTADVD